MKAKMKTTALILSAVAAGNASAFSLDFSSVTEGRVIGAPLVMNVPGYGEVIFNAGQKADGSGLSQLVVGDDYGVGGTPVRSIQMDDQETLYITFNGGVVSNVDLSYVGVSINETMEASMNATNNVLVVHYSSADGAGVAGVNFDAEAIPEPSSAILSLLAAGSLLIRRKR